MPLNKDNLVYLGVIEDYSYLVRKKTNHFFSKGLINAGVRNELRNTDFVNTLFVPLSGPLEGQSYSVLRCNVLDGVIVIKRTPHALMAKIEDTIKPFYFAVVSGVSTLTKDGFDWLLSELDKMIAGANEATGEEAESDGEVSSTEPESSGHSLQAAGDGGSASAPSPVEHEPRDEDYGHPIRPSKFTEKLAANQVWAVFEDKRNPSTGEVETIASVARRIKKITDAGVTYQQMGKYLGFVPKEVTGTGKAEQRWMRFGSSTVGYAIFQNWIKSSGAQLVKSRELITQLESF